MITRAAVWPSGTRVVWRSLTWGEYRDLKSLQGVPAEKALEVYKLVLLDGPGPDKVPAGIMLWIGNHELEQTPFGGAFQILNKSLQEARAKVQTSYLLSAQAFISSVFKIPFGDMNAWDSDTFLQRLAQAEFVSGVPLNPVDPSAPVSKELRQSRKKKPLNNTQQMAVERKYGPGSAAALRDRGEKPSTARTTETTSGSFIKS